MSPIGAPTAFRNILSISLASLKALAVLAVFLMWNTDENEHWIARFCSNALTHFLDMTIRVIVGITDYRVLQLGMGRWKAHSILCRLSKYNSAFCVNNAIRHPPATVRNPVVVLHTQVPMFLTS
eukprot:scaffold3793_cov275-Chaetoceros_neogracile.AAC.2